MTREELVALVTELVMETLQQKGTPPLVDITDPEERKKSGIAAPADAEALERM